MRPAWSTESVPEQSRLHRETLSPKRKRDRQRERDQTTSEIKINRSHCDMHNPLKSVVKIISICVIFVYAVEHFF